MSIATYTEWEIRTTGAATNGGGFNDLNPGTSVDYSQQASAQLALADIVSDVGGTGISSVTGGFTAAMEGNCVFIAGSGFTTGWYQITGYTDTNNITIDRSCGSSASGGTGNVGGAYDFDSTYNSTFFNSTNKGTYNKVHIAAGTYSGSFGSSALTVTALYLQWIGYNATREDGPVGTNRPFIDFGSAGARISWTSSFGSILNCRVDMTYASSALIAVTMSGTAPTVVNCKITRSGFTGATAIQLATYGVLLQCEVVCTSGTAVKGNQATSMVVKFCYIHDSTNGFTYVGSGTTGLNIDSCIFDTCSTTGILVYHSTTISNCTVYNCGTGIQSALDYAKIINSIVHTCTTGINAPEKSYEDFNIIYNCGTPRTGGIPTGPNSLTSNPLLADPANQDFTLDAGSPAFNTGIKLGATVGLP